MSNEELAIRIQAGETGLYPQLWEQVRGFVFLSARRFAGWYRDRMETAGAELPDLIQSGFLALADAVEAFDPQRGKLLTLLPYALRRHWRAAVGILSTRRDPLDGFRDSLDISREDSESGEALSLLDAVPDEAAAAAFEDAESRIYQDELRAVLVQVMEKALTQPQRVAVNSRYFTGGPCDAKQAQQAIRAMRRPEYSEQLRPFLPGSWLYYKGGFSAFKDAQASTPELIAEKRDNRRRYLEPIKKERVL